MKRIGKKTLYKAALSLSLSACLFCSMASTASAFYDVKDQESIDKLIEILDKTQETVDKISEQYNLMKKDLEGMSSEVSGALSSALKVVNDFVSTTLWTSDDASIVFNSTGSISVTLPTGCFGEGSSSISVPTSSDSDIQKALETAIPSIGTTVTNEDGTETQDVGLSAKQKAWISGVGYLLRSNTHTLKIYNNLNAYLLGYQKQLDELLSLNSKIEKGSVEAQQINNQISYVRGRIESVRTALTTLDSQQAIAKSHLETQDAMNACIQQDAQVKQMEKDQEARLKALEEVNPN